MRSATFQSVLWGTARLLGMDPTRDLTPQFAARFTEYLNRHVAKGWRFEKWPEWTLTEKRHYRPEYSTEENIVAGDERFYPDQCKYYQALQASQGQPPFFYEQIVVSGGGVGNATYNWTGSLYSDGDVLTIQFQNGKWQLHESGSHAYRSVTADLFGEWELAGEGYDNPPVPDVCPSGTAILNEAYWAECAVSYCSTKWLRDTAYSIGDQLRNPADGLFYQCIAAHTSGCQFDPTKFGRLTPFQKYIAYDGIYPPAYGEAPVTVRNSFRGTLALGNGVQGGAVAALALDFVPELAKVWITRPAGLLNLEAYVVSGSITANGFTFELNGVTDDTTYTLVYELFNDAFHDAISLAPGTQDGSVTGLGLSYIPSAVNAWVVRPSGGANIRATVIANSISSDGFSFELDGLTGSGDYKLAYELVSPTGNTTTRAAAETVIWEAPNPCAFRRDPRVFLHNPWPIHTTRNDRGIVFAADTPNEVFLQFWSAPPVFTSTPYRAGEAVSLGALRYYATTGECYAALRAQTQAVQPPTRTDYWALVKFPFVLSEYVKHAVASDGLRDQKQTDRAIEAMQTANDNLDDESDKALSGQGIYEQATVQVA